MKTANGLSRTRRASVIACGTPRTDTTEPTRSALTVHDPGVELDEAFLAQRGPTSRAEDARVLELAHRPLDRVERGAAVLEHLPAGAGRGEAAVAVDAVLGRGDVEGTAVDGDGRAAAGRTSCAQYLADRRRWI